jgi:hypothetical protein
MLKLQNNNLYKNQNQNESKSEVVDVSNNYNYCNSSAEISALLLGMDKHLLMIKTFDNTSDVMVYHEMFVLEESILKELNKSEHKVMAISFENFQEFYKNKDEDGYHNFFKKNYLTIE